MQTQQWTQDDVRALGLRTDIPTASDVLGLGKTTGYQLVKRGEFPVPVLRVGRKYIVPVAGLLNAFGIEADAPTSAA